jgi:hypothetical protein
MHWQRLGVVTLTLAVLAGCGGSDRPRMPPVDGQPPTVGASPPPASPPQKQKTLAPGASPTGGMALKK